MKLSTLSDKSINDSTRIVTTVDGGATTPISNIAAIAAAAGSSSPCWTGTVVADKYGAGMGYALQMPVPVGGQGYLKVLSCENDDVVAKQGFLMTVLCGANGEMIIYDYGPVKTMTGVILPLVLDVNWRVCFTGQVDYQAANYNQTEYIGTSASKDPLTVPLVRGSAGLSGGSVSIVGGWETPITLELEAHIVGL